MESAGGDSHQWGKPLESSSMATTSGRKGFEGAKMVRSFRLRVNDKLYTVEIEGPPQAPTSVTVNGQAFQVELERETPAEVRGPAVAARPAQPEGRESPAPPTPTRARPGASAKQVTAPMPGKIVAIKVKVGDRVKYGDELCVLEAMKMEQSIRATQEGVVKEIKVTVGQVVSYGSVLIEFE